MEEKATRVSTPRQWEGLFQGLRGKLLNAFIVGYFLFHLAYTGHLLTTQYIYLTFDLYIIISVLSTIILFCLFLPAKRGPRNSIPWYDFLLAGAGISGCAYLLHDIDMIIGARAITLTGVILGTMTLLVILEGVRRSLGLLVTLTVVLFFVYAMFSNYAPGLLMSKGFTYKEMIANSYLWDTGIFGMMADLWSKIVVLFILFAGLVQVSGAGNFIIRFALGLAGHLKGGPAKVAVMASGLLGSITPVGPANVAVTGSVTIPMMKRTGQTSEFAGAVEAVASTFGGLTPPIMGVLTFMIAEWLEMPYYMVILAALMPSFFYFFCLFFMVHFQAHVKAMPLIPRRELPSPWLALKEGWHYILPIAVFVFYLFVRHYTPQTSILYAIIALVVVAQFRRDFRLTPKRLMIAMQQAVNVGMQVAPLFIAVGIIKSSIGLTGLGIRFAGALVEVCAGNLVLLLVLTALTSFIMGMGMPMIACYFILAVLVAPALTEIGVLPIAAHLFMICAAYVHFYTPPVMPMVVIAAGLAGSNIWKTSWHAMRLAIVLVIVPFVFIYNPAILLQGGHGILETILVIVSCLIGIVGLAAGIQGWLVRRANWLQRLLLIASGMMIILNLNLIVTISGLCLLGLILVQHGITPIWVASKFRRRKETGYTDKGEEINRK